MGEGGGALPTAAAEAVAGGAALLLVDKPAGPTSHDVVAGIRRRLGRGTKLGHAGTLDPFATGLLVLLAGRATRLAPYLSGLDKTYVATVRLGAESVTGDPEGPVTPTGRPVPGPEAVRAALEGFLGRQVQRVPALSAVKVNGERLYRRTRRGEEPERPERQIEVHALRLLAAGAGEAVIEVRCGKGTYVRQLAVDLGARLGCGGYCAALRRTAVGDLVVGDAVPPERAGGGEGTLDPLRGLAHLGVRELAPRELAAVRHGGPVPGEADGPVALVAGGALVAVAHPDGAGALRPRVVVAV